MKSKIFTSYKRFFPSVYKSLQRHIFNTANMNNNKLTAHDLFTESRSQDNLLTIATTVDTGFEPQAVAECKEKFGKNVKIFEDRGKVYFNLQTEQFVKVQQMRSIDNIYIVGDVHKFQLSTTEKESDLGYVKDYIKEELNLEKYLNAWKLFSNYQGVIYPTNEEFERAYAIYKLASKECEPIEKLKGRKRGRSPSNSTREDVLTFRVTCERNGTHTFSSTELATVIGGELQDKYKWIVDLTTYHLEVYCKIYDNDLVTQLRVTPISKHHRNITHFGPTTLRSTICYNLLRLARPQIGDIIIDPMCGSGSIPIEAVCAYPQSYVLGGENHSKGVNRTKANIDTCNIKNRPDVLQWDAVKMPMKDSSVDIVVSDLPFGRRMGTVRDNRRLYKEFLSELGRTVKISTGRVVLLTHDKRSFNMAMQATRDLFNPANMVAVNIGGLPAVAYVLKRNDTPYEKLRSMKTEKPESKEKESEEKD